MKKRKPKNIQANVLEVPGFERELAKCCPGMKTQYRTVVDDNGIKRRVSYYEFPPLDVCKRMFEESLGCKIDWPD